MRKVFLGLILFMSSMAFANGEAPPSFTYEGRLYDSSNNPLAESVTFRLQIFNQAANCLLYEETQVKNLAPTDGIFAISVGTPTGDAKRSGNDPNFSMWQVFKNIGTLSGIPAAECAATTYTPALAETRVLRVHITPSSTGVPEQLVPDQTMNSVPTAVMSESLQGIGSDGFVQITGSVTQPIMEALAAGTSPLYLKAGDDAQFGDGVNYTNNGQIAIGTSTPDANAELEIENNAPTVRLEANAASGGDISIDFNSGANPQARIYSTEGTQELHMATGNPLVDALIIDNAQNATFMSTLQSSTLAINPSGGTGGEIQLRDDDGTTHYVALKAPNSLAADTTYIMPAAYPGSNMVLQSDSSGNLSWVAGGGGGSASGVSGAVQFSDGASGFSDDDANFHWDDTNNRLGIGTNTPSEALEVATNIRAQGLFLDGVNLGDEHQLEIRGASGAYRAGIKLGSTNTTNSGIIHLEPGTGDFIISTSTDDTNFNEMVRIDQAGNVGIGTNSPGSIFNVVKNQNANTFAITTNTDAGASAAAAFSATSDAGAFVLGQKSTAGGAEATLISTANGPMTFSPNSSEQMRIQATGQVGIGSNSPGARLHIDGAADELQLRIDSHAAQTAGSNIIEIRDNGGVVVGTFREDGAETAGTDLTTKDYVDTEITNAGGSFVEIAGDTMTGDLIMGAGTFDNPSGSEDIYVTGNLEVDGTIYGDASNLSNLPATLYSGNSTLASDRTVSGTDTDMLFNLTATGMTEWEAAITGHSNAVKLELSDDGSTFASMDLAIDARTNGTGISALTGFASTTENKQTLQAFNTTDGGDDSATITTLVNANFAHTRLSSAEAGATTDLYVGEETDGGDKGIILKFGAGSDLTIDGSTGTSGQVLTSGGDNAAPTWTTISATPSGVAGSIQFSDGSNLASDNANFFWDDTNDELGIGTNTPAAPLDVTTGAGSTLINGAGIQQLRTAGNQITASGGLRIRSDDNIYLNAQNGGAPKIFFLTNGGGAGIERMRIDEDGLVSIGTTTADQLFHVEQDDSSTNTVLYPNRITRTSSAAPGVGIGAGMEFEVETSAGNNELLATVETVTTNVGAGTEAADLVFKTMAGGTAAAERMRIASDGTVTATAFSGDGSGLSGVSANPAGSDGQIQYKDGAVTGGAAQLYYDDVNNRVGIGIAAPDNVLHVVDAAPIIELDATGAGGRDAGLTNNGDQFYITYDGTINFSVNGSDNVGVGSAVNQASKLSVQGNAAVGSSYYTTAAPTNGMIIEGDVGIGTSAPGSPLQINHNNPWYAGSKFTAAGGGGWATTGGAAMVVGNRTQGVNGTSAALAVANKIEADTALTFAAGIYGELGVFSNNDPGEAYALFGRFHGGSNASTWTDTGGLGIEYSFKTSTTTNAYGINIKDFLDPVPGTSTNTYGLHIGDLTRANITYTNTPYSIYASDADALVYFAGDVITGSGTFDNPSASADSYVTGNLEVDGIIYGNGAGITGVTAVPSGAAGSIQFSNGSVTSSDNANFFWDDTNDRLGIGTTTPTEAIHAIGDIELGTDGAAERKIVLNSDQAGSILTIETAGNFSRLRQEGGNINLALDSSGYLTFYDSTGKVMQIEGGEVGIGTGNPIEDFQLNKDGGTSTLMISRNHDGTDLANGDEIGILQFGARFNGGTDDVAEIIGFYDGDGTTRSGYLTFLTGNSGSPAERMRITKEGNVGIGTNAPTAALHVQGTGGSSYQGIQVQNTFTDTANKGAVSILGARKTNANGVYPVIGNWDDGTDRLVYVGGGGWGMPDATQLEFYTAPAYNETADQGVARMVIKPDGKIGIGTGTPSTELEVNGTITATAFSGSISPAGFTAGSVMFTDSDGLVEDNANFFWDDTNNRLGIGTATPAEDLHVGDTVQVDNEIKVSTGGSTDPSYTFIGDTDTGIYNSAADAIGFATGGSQKARIDSTGQLYINNTGAAVDVHRAAGAGTPDITIGTDTNIGTNQTALYFVSDRDASADWAAIGQDGDGGLRLTGGASLSSADIIIDNSGNVGIGDDLTPEALLHVTDDQDATTAIRLDNSNQGTDVVHTSYQLWDGSTQMGFVEFNNFQDVMNIGAVQAGSQLKFSTANTERLRIDGSGNVGIGIAAPESLVHVNSTGNAEMQIEGNSGTAYSSVLRLFGENENNWKGGYIQYDAGNNDLVIGVHDADDKATGSDIPALTIDRGTGDVDMAGAVIADNYLQRAVGNVNVPASYTLPAPGSGDIYRITLTGNATITLPTESAISNSVTQIVVSISQDGTGSRTLTWAGGGDTIKWSGGSEPAVCAGANEETVYQFFNFQGGNTWYGSLVWSECP